MDIQLVPDLNHFPVPVGYCINWIHGPERIQTYAMQCPTCSRAFCLVDHTIGNDGTVNPSVVCPANCGFHVMMVIKR
jgi:hypothetical protein